MAEHQDSTTPIRYEPRGHVGVVEICRPERKNAFTVAMFREMGEVFRQAEEDPEIRCVVVHAVGDHFTVGLELVEVLPRWIAGEMPFGDDAVDPWGIGAARRTKPLITTAKGWTLTLGTELALAADLCVASRNATFGLREVRHGIMPAGGATFRLGRAAGWGNAMRWLLTGDDFDAEEAYRIGVVQELVDGDPLDRALALAETIATRAPLAVRAVLQSAFVDADQGAEAAAQAIVPAMRELLTSRDVGEAVTAFVAKRTPKFEGR